jgi:hypothetical protein
MNSKWVFVEAKSEIIKEVIGNIIDGKDINELDIRIIDLDEYDIDNIDYISFFGIDDFRKLITNESVKIFK